MTAPQTTTTDRPTRPATPTLDAYYAATHGAQNPRYEESQNGVVDNALNTFRGDRQQGIFGDDQAAVSPDDVNAAQQYLDDVEAFTKLHGGFWTPDGATTTDHSDVSALQAEQAAPSDPNPSQPPVALPIPDGHTLVDIPAHVAEELPAGTVVSTTPAGHLVATVKTETGIQHIFAELGNEWHHLIATVTRFFGHPAS
ncbi:MAG: hypothetical protein JWM41_2875 [Gemmatimonadetes bacterium]|nr:hypothetical protein [Gemmatimonadota bacterium]